MVKAKAGVAKLRQKAERRAKVLSTFRTFLHHSSDAPVCRGQNVCCIPCEVDLSCLWMQDVAAKQRESEGRDPHIAQRLQKKVTKRVQFLENVASSKRQASLAVQGGLKKKRKKDRVGKRLGDLSQLAASLREASQLVRLPPTIPRADGLLHASSDASTQPVRGLVHPYASHTHAVMCAVDFAVIMHGIHYGRLMHVLSGAAGREQSSPQQSQEAERNWRGWHQEKVANS